MYRTNFPVGHTFNASHVGNTNSYEAYNASDHRHGHVMTLVQWVRHQIIK